MPNQSWEEKFDKTFTDNGGFIRYWNNEKEFTMPARCSQIKSFISHLLKERDAEVAKQLRQTVLFHEETGDVADAVRAYCRYELDTVKTKLGKGE